MAFLPRLSMAKAVLSPSTSGGKSPRVLTAGLLNLDNLSACLHEHQRCQWPRQQRAEIENQKTGQRLHEIT